MNKSLAALALAALWPLTAPAADLDYSHAEAAYSQAQTGIGAGGWGYTGGQGFMLDGSYALGPHWFAEAAYRYNDFHQYQPTTSVDLAPQSLRLGGGFHAAILDSVDFTAHLDYVLARTSVTVDQPDSEVELNDTGLMAGLGLRIHPTDLFEVDLGLDQDKLGLGRRALTTCSPACVVTSEVRQDQKENLLSVAARYDFGHVIGGVEYRRGNAQGWRELLVSLRMNF